MAEIVVRLVPDRYQSAESRYGFGNEIVGFELLERGIADRLGK